MAGHAFSVEVADGHSVTINTDAFPRCARLAVQLAAHWRSSFAGVTSSSVSVYATTLRSLLRYTERLDGPPPDLRFLDAQVLDGWVRSLRETSSAGFARQRATCMRVLLDNLDPELLHESLTEGSGVLRWRPEVERGGLASVPDLTPGQWEALRKVAKRQVFTITCRLMAAQREAAGGCDPGDDPVAWSKRENVSWLALHGRLSADALLESLRGGRRCAPWPAWALELIRPGTVGIWAAKQIVAEMYHRVHPHRLDAASFWVAMLIATGLPPESVTDLEPDWFDTPPGGAITLLRYRKQRRAAPTVPLVLLATTRFSAQRLRDSYLALSVPLRRLAGDSSAGAKLWSHATTSRGGSLSVGALDAYGRHFPRWLKAVGLTDAAQVRDMDAARRHRVTARGGRGLSSRTRGVRLRPLEPWTGPADPRRIRKTDKAQRLVLHGASMAANDHTVRVLIAHYTNSDLVRIRSAHIVTGVAETLTYFAAGPRRPTVIPAPIAEEALAYEDALTGLANLIGLDPGKLTAVLAGRQTIGSAACRDPYDSPHDTAGQFCRQAGGELCVSCPQAVLLAEHVPALWAELERLDRVGATISPTDFTVLHGERHRLIVDLLSVLDPDNIARYRERGIVPGSHHGDEIPVRLRRRRAR